MAMRTQARIHACFMTLGQKRCTTMYMGAHSRESTIVILKFEFQAPIFLGLSDPFKQLRRREKRGYAAAEKNY